MLKTISAIKVRQNLGQVMNEVALKDDEYIIERAGKPLAALIPIAQYQSMKKEREEFFQMVDEIQKGMKKADSSLIDEDIQEAAQSYRRGESRKLKKTGK